MKYNGKSILTVSWRPQWHWRECSRFPDFRRRPTWSWAYPHTLRSCSWSLRRRVNIALCKALPTPKVHLLDTGMFVDISRAYGIVTLRSYKQQTMFIPFKFNNFSNHFILVMMASTFFSIMLRRMKAERRETRTLIFMSLITGAGRLIFLQLQTLNKLLKSTVCITYYSCNRLWVQRSAKRLVCCCEKFLPALA